MNDHQLSKSFDLEKDYFAVLKHTNREKYNFIFSFDKDRKKSVLKYMNYIEELYSKVIDIFYSFDNPWKFGIWASECKLYTHPSPTIMQITIFKIFDNYLSAQWNVVKKLEKIIQFYYLGKVDYYE